MNKIPLLFTKKTAPYENQYSFLFDGVTKYFTVPDANDLSFGNGVTDTPFSITGWVNLTTFLRAGIIGKYATGAREWALDFNGDSKLEMVMYDESAGSYIVSGLTSAPTNTNTWNFIAGTYAGDGLETGIIVYYNQTTGTVRATSGTYTAMENSTAAVEIARLDPSTFYTSGNIDVLTIWNIALTASEVEEARNGGIPNDLTYHSRAANRVSSWAMGEGATLTSDWAMPDTVGLNNATSVNMVLGDRSTSVPT